VTRRDAFPLPPCGFLNSGIHKKMDVPVTFAEFHKGLLNELESIPLTDCLTTREQVLATAQEPRLLNALQYFYTHLMDPQSYASNVVKAHWIFTPQIDFDQRKWRGLRRWTADYLHVVVAHAGVDTMVRHFLQQYDDWALRAVVSLPNPDAAIPVDEQFSLLLMISEGILRFFQKHREFLSHLEQTLVQATPRARPIIETPSRAGERPTRKAARRSDDRRALIDDYINEVGKMTGKKITRKDIWREARYKDSTEFERWQRNDPRTTEAATRAIKRILDEKPHLK
jgi:hypothetical protein